ncbi:hypothetical protein QBC37DRAFT_315229 [Rhypophila decipiens]|uniref:Uncharacterized protein n=1 Tax=Rhypophila decipiens TaxID=261697 RepID=A0AAN6Y9V5_9PEZI|nr:hypothetical protein QBC37DRAFT_315229 [Rhypophila decipiens]
MPKWEEIRDDLFEAIMAVQPALGKEQQEQVVVFMQSRGHNMVWNAIRYVTARTCHKQHVWTTEAYKDVLMALNNHFCPNAADCRAIIGELRSKGWSYSDNALLHQFCTQSPHLNMAPTNWDHDAHLALLQAVMSKAPPTQSEWDQILEEVGRKGYVYTSGAAM